MRLREIGSRAFIFIPCEESPGRYWNHGYKAGKAGCMTCQTSRIGPKRPTAWAILLKRA